MNTFLSEDTLAFKSQCEQFVKDKLAASPDSAGSMKTDPNAFLAEMATAGFLALNVPLEYGGKDNPFLYSVLLAQTIANYDAGIILCLAYHVATIELIKAYGSDEQKRKYLPKLAQGKLLGTLAYLESAPNNSPTKIISQNLLNGQKDLVVISELGDANGSGTALVNLILVAVDKSVIVLDDFNAPTIKITKQKMPMGFTSITLASLTFDNYVIQADSYLESQPSTDESFTHARNIIKTILAAAALGMSDYALNAGVECTKANQRGGLPLSQSQAIEWKLADAATDISAARLLTYRAAWSKDEDKENFSQYATMAKAYATKVARIHTGEGLQIILPFLQNMDSPLTSFYLDSKMLEAFDATNEEEKILLSKLLGI